MFFTRLKLSTLISPGLFLTDNSVFIASAKGRERFSRFSCPSMMCNKGIRPIRNSNSEVASPTVITTFSE